MSQKKLMASYFLFYKFVRMALSSFVFDEITSVCKLRVLGVDCIVLPDSLKILDTKFKCLEDELVTKIINILKTNMKTKDIYAQTELERD